MAQNATPGDGEKNGARPSPAVAAPNSGELVRTEAPRAYGLAGETARHLSRTDGLDPALVLKSEQVLGLHQAGHLFAIDPLGRGCSTVAMCGVVEFGSDATSAPDAVFSVENGLDLSGHQSVI